MKNIIAYSAEKLYRDLKRRMNFSLLRDERHGVVRETDCRGY